MKQLNAFFRAYGHFDVKQGTLGLYTEFAAKNGAFKGYVNPLIKNLDIVDWNSSEGNLAQILWETLVGSAAEIFENQPKDQLATKIPLEGRFDQPEAGLFDAVVYVLKNAFVQALRPSIDHSIAIGKVEAPAREKKGLLRRIFHPKDRK